MSQSSTQVSRQNLNDGNTKTPKPPCRNLPSTSGARSDVLENGTSLPQNNAPLIRSNFVSLDGQLSRCPSVTVHSIPMVTIPAEEYQQLMEMVNELGRELKEHAREIRELKEGKRRLYNTSASEHLDLPMSVDLVKENTQEIKELKDWKQHVDQTLTHVKKMTLPGSDRDAQEVIKMKEREIEGYKREIKELRDWKEIVVQRLCGTEKAALPMSNLDSQGKDKKDGIQVQEWIMDEQKMAKEHASAVQENNSSKQSGEESLTWSHAKTMALPTSTNTFQMDERFANGVEADRASEHSVDQQSNSTKSSAQQKSKEGGSEVKDRASQHVTLPSGEQVLRVNEGLKRKMLPFVPDYKAIARKLTSVLFSDDERVKRDVLGHKGAEMDPERIAAIYEAVFDLCPAGEMEKVGMWKKCVAAINCDNRHLYEPPWNVITGRCKSDTDAMKRLQEITLPSGDKVLRVTTDFKKSLLPLVPSYKDVARRLVTGLFMDSERIGFDVRGRRSRKMDPRKMEAVFEAVFELCPAKEEEKERIWQICVNAINDQNRSLKKSHLKRLKSSD